MSMLGRALSVGTFLKHLLSVGSSRKDLTCICPHLGFCQNSLSHTDSVCWNSKATCGQNCDFRFSKEPSHTSARPKAKRYKFPCRLPVLVVKTKGGWGGASFSLRALFNKHEGLIQKSQLSINLWLFSSSSKYLK